MRALIDSPFLTPSEAAAYLHVSKSFLDKLRMQDGGPRFIKAGRRVRYRIATLEQWMQAREKAATHNGEPRGNA